jgi:type VI secretion system protein ImpM
VQENLDGMQRAGLELSEAPTYFVHHRLDPAVPVTVGALCRSRDRVGRVYPMIVFVRVDPAWIASRFPGVSVGYGLFLRGAARILGDLARADAQLLGAWTKQLRPPSAQELGAADGVCRQSLDGIAAGSVHTRLFGDPSRGLRYHAFKTVIDACDVTRAGAGRVPITLDIPLGADVDLFALLELCRRRLYGSGVVPTMVWREDADPRAMVALGPAHGAMLRYLARPSEQASALWPVVTDRYDVIAQSAQALHPHHRQALDRFDLSLEVLLGALSR